MVTLGFGSDSDPEPDPDPDPDPDASPLRCLGSLSATLALDSLDEAVVEAVVVADLVRQTRFRASSGPAMSSGVRGGTPSGVTQAHKHKRQVGV